MDLEFAAQSFSAPTLETHIKAWFARARKGSSFCAFVNTHRQWMSNFVRSQLNECVVVLVRVSSNERKVVWTRTSKGRERTKKGGRTFDVTNVSGLTLSDPLSLITRKLKPCQLSVRRSRNQHYQNIPK